MSASSSTYQFCYIHGGFYGEASCPRCAGQPAQPASSSGTCSLHGAFAGGPCIECAAEQQPTDDTLARFSTHHALWRGARHDIEQLQEAESRQDAALTDLEAAIADMNKLYDQIAEVQRQLSALSTKVAQLLREQSRFSA
jgi:hypothetical protein